MHYLLLDTCLAETLCSAVNVAVAFLLLVSQIAWGNRQSQIHTATYQVSPTKPLQFWFPSNLPNYPTEHELGWGWRRHTDSTDVACGTQQNKKEGSQNATNATNAKNDGANDDDDDDNDDERRQQRRQRRQQRRRTTATTNDDDERRRRTTTTTATTVTMVQ